MNKYILYTDGEVRTLTSPPLLLPLTILLLIHIGLLILFSIVVFKFVIIYLASVSKKRDKYRLQDEEYNQVAGAIWGTGKCTDVVVSINLFPW